MPILRTINVKHDMPTADVARRRLIDELAAARRDGVRVLKLVHGYGSSGVGGVLRTKLRDSLRKRRKEGQIRAYVYGEKWTSLDAGARALIEECPDLQRDEDLGYGNEGITLILL